jgi:hypothetical protein
MYRIHLVSSNAKVDYVSLVRANRADAEAVFKEFDYEKQGVVEKTQLATLFLCSGFKDVDGDGFSRVLSPYPVQII